VPPQSIVIAGFIAGIPQGRYCDFLKILQRKAGASKWLFSQEQMLRGSIEENIATAEPP
jgi:hypothetical protein